MIATSVTLNRQREAGKVREYHHHDRKLLLCIATFATSSPLKDNLSIAIWSLL
jgi:hypothetical protein